MSTNPFHDAFGDIFGSVGTPESPMDKIKSKTIDAYKRDLKELEERRANLILKARNQNDRSYNKALKDASEINGLSLPQVSAILALQVEPRHKKEFGG